jgi:hypothetical protein
VGGRPLNEALGRIMSSEVEAKKIVDSLVSELGDPTAFSFYIPDWNPVDSTVAIRWLQGRLFEAFFVAHRIDGANKKVFFKFWEFGQVEPAWESQRYTG